jgi:hypothetical protein
MAGVTSGSAWSDPWRWVVVLQAVALLLGCPEARDEPGPSVETLIGSAHEEAFARGAAWLGAQRPFEVLDLGEEMFVLCEIVGTLGESSERSLAVELLRDDFARVSAAYPDPSQLPRFNLVGYQCAAGHLLGRSYRSWDPLLRGATKLGFRGRVIVPALTALWPFFSNEDQARVRVLARRWLSEEAWLAERQLPDLDDLRAWYRLTHVIFVATANGKAPAVGILSPEEREWLRSALGDAIAGFMERPGLRQGDILAEVLVNQRTVAPAPDPAFDRGLDFSLGLQRPDGSFGPPADLEGASEVPLDDLRHQTLVSLLALAVSRADRP